jgi:phosphopantothenoylcysteine decarboxylase/phosphopantothenate--cysteine ligase
MSDPAHIVDAVIACLGPGTFRGSSVLVTSGGTRERIDAARCLANYSSGKMGHALARAAYYLGADVTCITTVRENNLPRAIKTLYAESAEQMFSAVKENFGKTDIAIMAAAVADHRPSAQKSGKIKKKDLTSIKLVQNPDILEYMGKNRENRLIVGFALETKNGLKEARKKLLKKKCHIMALNNPLKPGSGFGGDTNIVTLVDAKKNTVVFPKMEKIQVAIKIMEHIVKFQKRKNLK